MNSNTGSLRSTSKTKAARIAGGLAAFALLSAGKLAAQESFNPASVMPSECRNGSFHCGFLPPNPDEYRSLPMVDSAFYKDRSLPGSFDLSSEMPPVGFQGEQGSCLGWSLAYAIRSYQERKLNGWSYDSPIYGGPGLRVMSPSFLYNQINGGRDQGSDPIAALRLLVSRGVSTWNKMPYNLSDYRSQPGPDAIAEAMQFRSRGFRTIDSTSVDSVKSELSKGNPVMLGILAYENFYKLDKSSPAYDEFRGKFYGGHAVTIVGYDDSREVNGSRGAFKIMNSWGRAWGENGFGYISYRFFPRAATAGFTIEQRDRSLASPASSDNLFFAPREFAATRGMYEDRVELTWSAVPGAVAYEIQRGAIRFEKIGFSINTRFTDNAVEQGVPYKYRIVSIYRNGRSDADVSPVAEGFARAPGIFERYVLPPVLDVVVSTFGSAVRAFSETITPSTPSPAPAGGMQISWAPVPGAEWYEISRFDPFSRTFQTIGASREPAFRDALGSLQSVYSVRARSQLSAGAWSSSANPLLKITRVDASKLTFRDRITVSWESVPGVSRYVVYFYDPSRQKYTGNMVVTGTRYVDESASAKSGAWVGYSVAPLFDDQAGKFTGPVFGKSNPNMNRSLLPIPDGVAVETRPDSALIKWNAVPGADHYFVFRKKESDASFALYAEVRATQFKDAALKPGQLYYYTIRAGAADSESGDSEAVASALPGSLARNMEKQAREQAAPTQGARDDAKDASSRSMSEGRLSPGQSEARLTSDPLARTWGGVYWTGSEPQKVKITISRQGAAALVLVQFPARPAVQLRGQHPAGAEILDIPGLRAYLVRGNLVAQFTDNSVAPYPLRIVMDPQ